MLLTIRVRQLVDFDSPWHMHINVLTGFIKSILGGEGFETRIHHSFHVVQM